MLRSPLTYVGIALVAGGGVWLLQGLGYLEGSPMTGEALWAAIGPIVMLAGVALLVRAARERSGDRRR